jgi:hypothetical protein
MTCQHLDETGRTKKICTMILFGIIKAEALELPTSLHRPNRRRMPQDVG